MLSNLFRKNKRYRYHSRNSWSGSGAVVKDFCEHKEMLKFATGHDVELVATKNVLGYSYGIYEIIRDRKPSDIIDLWKEEEKPLKSLSTRELLEQQYRENKK